MLTSLRLGSRPQGATREGASLSHPQSDKTKIDEGDTAQRCGFDARSAGASSQLPGCPSVADSANRFGLTVTVQVEESLAAHQIVLSYDRSEGGAT